MVKTHHNFTNFISHPSNVQDNSMASSISDMDRDSKAQDHDTNPPWALRQSYSSMSLSLSRFSADSGGGGGADSLDSGVSPYFAGGEVSANSPDLEGSHLDPEARENAKLRYKEKKKSRL